MDMSLPVVDGWEATRRLKADAANHANPDHCADGTRDGRGRKRAREAGCDDYDTKPIELARLLEKIESLAGRCRDNMKRGARSKPSKLAASERSARAAGNLPGPRSSCRRKNVTFRKPVTICEPRSITFSVTAKCCRRTSSCPRCLRPIWKKFTPAGRQLLALIAEYFDEETFDTKRGNVHRLCHDLRTPVNQIIGYSEILQEQAEEIGRKKYLPDLRKIRDAAASWLGLMEEHLLPGGRPGRWRTAHSRPNLWIPESCLRESLFNPPPPLPAPRSRSSGSRPVAGGGR